MKVTTTAAARSFGLAAAAGTIAGVATINKFGRNTDVDAAEDIWTGGGTWVAPTAARTHQIASSSANDDGSPAGTGARTIRVFGLKTWASKETSEDITLNGTSNVATANSYVIIHRMRVLTAGSSGPNVGNITATADTDGTVTARIAAGLGQTEMAIYGVPSAQKILITKYYAGILRATAGYFDASLLINQEPDANAASYVLKHVFSANNFVQYQFDPPAIFAGPMIIKVRATPPSVNSDIVAGFDGYLIDA